MKQQVANLHHTNFLHTQGGMQRMIRLHLEAGTDRAISFRDHPVHDPDPLSDVLGGEPGTAIRTIRERYRKAVENLEVGVSIYHNCWGIELVHDLDPAPIRVGFLHSDFPRFRGMLRHYARYFDAFVNINPGLHERCEGLLPEWARDRLILLDSPVELPAELPSPGRKTCTIGIVGRLKREQKRLDRLPYFLEICDKSLGDYEVHILGSGDYEEKLRRKLSRRKNVRFLGWIEGNAYWEALRSWRYLLFLSDYEGTPLSLIEGVHAGLKPIYPDFHPGAPLPAGLTKDNLYPKGDVAAAVHRIVQMERDQTRMVTPVEASELARTHAPQRYLAHFADALEPAHLAALPRPSGRQAAPDKSFPEWATLGLYNMSMKRRRFGLFGIIWHR